MALDAPGSRDVVEVVDGIEVIRSRQDLARIPAFRIDVLGDTLVALVELSFRPDP